MEPQFPCKCNQHTLVAHTVHMLAQEIMGNGLKINFTCREQDEGMHWCDHAFVEFLAENSGAVWRRPSPLNAKMWSPYRPRLKQQKWKPSQIQPHQNVGRSRVYVLIQAVSKENGASIPMQIQPTHFDCTYRAHACSREGPNFTQKRFQTAHWGKSQQLPNSGQRRRYLFIKRELCDDFPHTGC